MRQIGSSCYIFVTAVLLLSVITSCQESQIPGTLSSGATFVMESSEGSLDTVKLDFNGPWEVVSSPEWCSVSPAEGNAGPCVLTVTATSANTALHEKEGIVSIMVNAGDEVSCYVVQRGEDGISLISDAGLYVSPDEGSEVRISIEGNTAFDESSLSSDVDWLTYRGVEITSDSLVLGDGETVSEYYTADIILAAGENASGSLRSGYVSVGGDEVAVTQVVSPEWSRDFYRHSAMIKITATWCTNCPLMEVAFGIADEQMPGRIVPMNMHRTDSDGGLGWSGTDTFEKLYSVASVPMVAFNGFAKFQSLNSPSSTAMLMTRVAEEAVQNFPSRTSIMAAASLTDRDIRIDAFVAAKEGGDYLLAAYVLEDSIIGFQDDAHGIVEDPYHYVHRHIVRGSLTELTGDPVPAVSDGEMAHIIINGELPSSVSDPSNTYIVLYVSTPGDPDMSLCTVPSVNYASSGYVIDNVTTVQMNGFTDFQYE